MTIPPNQAPPHPDAFTGPYAITPDNLWLMVWQDPDRGNSIQQWILLADPGEVGSRTLAEAASGIGRLLFGLSLSQFRQAIDALGNAGAVCRL